MNTQAAARPILLVADHKWRDLPGMVWLKVVLEDQYHMPAVVTSYAGVSACLHLFRPRALALSTLIGPREQKLARAARAIGSAVIVIPTEGIPGSKESMAGIFRDPQTWDICDLYLPWGPVMADFAVAEGYLPKDKVCLTGTGRFDFYRLPLSACLLSRTALDAHFGLRPNAPIVTWAASFVLASYGENKKRFDYTERDIAQRGLSHIEGFADLPAIVKKEQDAKAIVLACMRACCEQFPDVEFLIKPHPYDEFALYEQLADECKRDGLRNFHLVTDVYVWDLLKHASLHVHGGSTTGIEAWLMGVPTINLQPGGYARFKGAVGGATTDQERLDDTQTEVNTMCRRVQAYVRGEHPDQDRLHERQRFIGQWFHKCDGRAAERQAAAIADLLKNHAVPATSDRRPPWVGRRAPLTYVHYCINQLLGRPFDEPFIQRGGAAPLDFLGQRDKVVRQRDVDVWERRIREVLVQSRQPS